MGMLDPLLHAPRLLTTTSPAYTPIIALVR